MSVIPTSDRVIVKREMIDAKSTGGILITHTGTVEKPGEGVVVAVGPGRTTRDGVLVPMTVKVGDRVIFGVNAGQDFKAAGESLVMLREEEIMAIRT